MIKLTQLIQELGINKPSEYDKLKKGGEYLITYDLGDEEPYHFPLKIIGKYGSCCIAIHMHRNDIDYYNLQDIEDFSFTLCKDNVIKVEPYNLNELGINKGVTVEEVYDYFIDNIYNNTNPDELSSTSKGWEKYIELKEKYNNNKSIDTIELIKILSQQNLNRFYQDMKNLVKKYTQLNELGMKQIVK